MSVSCLAQAIRLRSLFEGESTSLRQIFNALGIEAEISGPSNHHSCCLYCFKITTFGPNILTLIALLLTSFFKVGVHNDRNIFYIAKKQDK